MGKKEKKKTAIQRVVKNKPKAAITKKKNKVFPAQGKIFITATFNNTIISVTDLKGNIVAWSTTGKLGFKGARKSTPFAATQTMNEVIERVKEKGLRQVDVLISGPGMGREAAVRAVKNSGIKIASIADITSIPHNGCRLKGRRRV